MKENYLAPWREDEDEDSQTQYPLLAKTLSAPEGDTVEEDTGKAEVAPSQPTAADYEEQLAERNHKPFDFRTLAAGLIRAAGSYSAGEGHGTKALDSYISRRQDEREQERKDRVGNFLKGRELAEKDKDAAWTDKSRARDETEWGQMDEKYAREKAENDPNHPAAISARGIMAKRLKVDPKSLEGMNYKQLVEAARLAEQQQRADTGEWQKFNVTLPDGRTVTRLVHTKTGQTRELLGTNETTGYAGGWDPTLGAYVNKSNPTTPLIPAVMPGGETAANARTKLEGERAGERKLGTEGAIAAVDVAKAEASGERAFGNIDNWRKLYKDAYAANDAGPIAGRVGGAANTLGYSRSKAGDALRSALKAEQNKMLKELSGAQVTDGEQQRIMAEFPSENLAPALFEARLVTFRQKADKAITEAKARQSKLSGPAAEGAPATPPGKTTTPGVPDVLREEISADGTTKKVTYSDGSVKEFKRK